MKKNFILLFITIIPILPFNLFAQSKLTVEVKEAGKLLTQLDGKGEQIKELTVLGKINYTDFETMKKMICKGKLTDLNLEKTSYVYEPSNEDNRIPSRAFSECDKLESIILPESIEGISGMAFEKCSNLKSVKFPSTLSFIDIMAFQSCTSLTEINLPNNPIKLWYASFWGCTSLKSIVFPEGCYIGKNAFSYCTLDEIFLPANYECISPEAFNRSCEIKTIYCQGGPTNCIADNSFSDWIKNNATVHIPIGTMEKYTSWETTCWSDFKLFQEYKVPTSNQYIFSHSTQITPKYKSLSITTNETSNISIYTLNGHLVFCENITPGVITIPLQSGFYVVKTNGICNKIIIK
ncbi:leucine-rich repeat domain-containing protein [Parabacteroides segnis]|uniref:leucine-rich repeat domain-containing protein n=1 Tax=Parabacteroides segnis TaxID=2763058 RepID=UPI003518E919